MKLIEHLLQLNSSFLVWTWLAAAAFAVYRLITTPKVKHEDLVLESPLRDRSKYLKESLSSRFLSPLLLWSLAYSILCVSQVIRWRHEPEAFNNFMASIQSLYLWIHGEGSKVTIIPLLYVIALEIFMLGSMIASTLAGIANDYFYERLWSNDPDLKKAVIVISDLLEKKLRLQPIVTPGAFMALAIINIFTTYFMFAFNFDLNIVALTLVPLIAILIYTHFKYATERKQRREFILEEGRKFIAVENYKSIMQRTFYGNLLWKLLFITLLSVTLALPSYYAFNNEGVLLRSAMNDEFIAWEKVDEIKFQFNIHKAQIDNGRNNLEKHKDSLSLSMLIKSGDRSWELNYLDVLNITDDAVDVVRLALDSGVNVEVVEPAEDEKKLLDEILMNTSEKRTEVREKRKFEKYVNKMDELSKIKAIFFGP